MHADAAFLERAERCIDPIRVALTAIDLDVWIVGGTVRDLLLGRDPVDIDVVVGGPPEQVAQSLARVSNGHAFRLNVDHPCWRIALREEWSIRQIDVCPPLAKTIEGDLALRDVSVNAIAFPWDDPAKLIDPTGGAVDLQRRIIRTHDARNLDDDPLRLLRVVRFAAQLDATIDPATAAAVSTRAATIVEPSGERVLVELEAMFLQPSSRSWFDHLSSSGLLDQLVPEVDGRADEIGAVLDDIDELIAADDSVDPFEARCAALLLPAGTRSKHPLERWRASRHAQRNIAGAVAGLWKLDELLGPDPDARWFHRAQRSLGAAADLTAAIGVGDAARALVGSTVTHEQAQAFRNAVASSSATEPLLDGTEIAQIAGMQPGPALGALVEQLAEEQAVGAVTSRAAAEQWVRQSS